MPVVTDAAYARCMRALKQAGFKGYAHKPLSGMAAKWANQFDNIDNIVTQRYMYEFVNRLLADDKLSTVDKARVKNG